MRRLHTQALKKSSLTAVSGKICYRNSRWTLSGRSADHSQPTGHRTVHGCLSIFRAAVYVSKKPMRNGSNFFYVSLLRWELHFDGGKYSAYYEPRFRSVPCTTIAQLPQPSFLNARSERSKITAGTSMGQGPAGNGWRCRLRGGAPGLCERAFCRSGGQVDSASA